MTGMSGEYAAPAGVRGAYTSFGQGIRMGILLGFLRSLRTIPYFIFTRLWSYREQVIRKNLRTAFPDLSEKETARLIRRYYQHLSNLCVEPFLLGAATDRYTEQLVQFGNLELVESLIRQKKDVVLMASHCGNWEYLQALPLYIKAPVLAAYSPPSSRWLNRLLKAVRSKYGVRLVEKGQWHKTALQWPRHEPAVFLMIADQRPPGESKQKVCFFNRLTSIQSGAFRLAAQREAAVVYVDVETTGANRYRFTFKLLAMRVTPTESYGLMQAYYRLLEQTIHRAPEAWLWSHNRWKFR